MLIPVYECHACGYHFYTKTECPECKSRDSVFAYYAEQVTDSPDADKCPCCGGEICTCWEDPE
jgi:hypothetical protein